MLTKQFASRGLAVAALTALLLATSGAQAEDAFKCMEETQEKCDFENENLRLFIQGRDAFERGMETGDFTETRVIGQKLAERKAQGLLNARERLDRLFDPGSFLESGLHGVSVRPEDKLTTPADGKVADARPEEAEAYLHMWCVTAHLLGIVPALLPLSLDDAREITAAIKGFLGDQYQKPPMYSAPGE